MQENHSEKDMADRSFKTFTIRGAFCGDKCFPSLNQYITELGRNPRCGAKYKKQYVMIATVAIRRDLKRFKTNKPVILHYTFAEPRKGAKRDYGNIFALADKFIEDALRDCKVIPDDNPHYVKNFTHDFVYTDGDPYIRVEIEEVETPGEIQKKL